ncbi:MAG: hypothetical protein AMXMBFR84_03400 [Candidatus Hydrogenedentota bacterium]
MTGLVDTHCHVQGEAFEGDRNDVLERALSVLRWIVLIGDTLASSRRGAEMTREGVYAAVGVHPYHPEEVTEAGLAELREMARLPRVVAIGEIGLDYYKYNQAPRDAQHAAFRSQLELASELDLPVIIHNRESHTDLMSILAEFDGQLPDVLMHCFAGDQDFLQACIERGYYISFAGNSTYPKAQPLRDAAAQVPEGKLLVETDSPYLSPQALRGKRCEPAYVAHTARALAELRGLTLDAFADLTTANARRFFRIHDA